jgi:hypothetical protein
LVEIAAGDQCDFWEVDPVVMVFGFDFEGILLCDFGVIGVAAQIDTAKVNILTSAQGRRK